VVHRWQRPPGVCVRQRQVEVEEERQVQVKEGERCKRRAGKRV